MEKLKAIKKLESLIEPIENLKKQKSHGQEFKKWRRDTEIAIERIFDKNSRHIKDFGDIRYSLSAFFSGTPDSEFEDAYRRGLDTAKTILNSFIDEIQEYWEESKDEALPQLNAIEKVKLIIHKFHLVAKQLCSRYDNRSTIKIDDEYDVQDLFHALLKLHFDYIIPEDPTSSYGGGSSRIDFVLKEEKIAIEVKKPREGLKDKKLGEELLIDINRYQTHKDCKTLICFVYDPEGYIKNPRVIEKDLSKAYDRLDVEVLIRPKT
ncbi:MAG: hypothetical protein PF638_15070 [Candidatus Delongbacteria bacterium]|nr:hypothetical protein [Candidatus Delongbacteria bacterium]